MSLQAAFQAFKTRCSMASVLSASDRKKLGDWNRLPWCSFLSFCHACSNSWQLNGLEHVGTLETMKGNTYSGFKIGRLELVCMMTIDYRFLLSSPKKNLGAVLSLTRKLAAAIAMGDNAHIAFGAKCLRKTSRYKTCLNFCARLVHKNLRSTPRRTENMKFK